MLDHRGQTHLGQADQHAGTQPGLPATKADAVGIAEAARQIASEFKVRAAEGEALRTMPADLADRVKQAGVFRLSLPRSLGGLELDPITTIEIIEQLSHADGSAGWTVMIGNSTAFFAWLEPGVAKDMIAGNPDFASTSMFAPMGKARSESLDAFTVYGRWPFNSGCRHSEWLQVGVLVMDGDTPAMRAPDVADWRLAFVPSELASIEDTWDAGGLRGTGSHHLSISDKRIPREHFTAPFYEPALHSGPLWRLPFFTLLAVLIAGFPLGVARRTLDEFTEIARTKVRGGALQTVAHDGYAQVELARAEGRLQSARSFIFDAAGDLWRSACNGDLPSLEQRARMLLASNQAMRASVEAVDGVQRLAGAEAVLSNQPLQRCFRDIHAANQHIIFSAGRDQAYARLRFGIDQSSTFM